MAEIFGRDFGHLPARMQLSLLKVEREYEDRVARDEAELEELEAGLTTEAVLAQAELRVKAARHGVILDRDPNSK